MSADTRVDPRDLELTPPPWVPALRPGSFHAAPSGVEVRATSIGLGLFATRAFSEGAVIFSRTPHFIPDTDVAVPVEICVDGVRTQIVVDRSLSVRLGRYRHVSMPDYVFNHACDPNTYTRPRADGISFDQVAERDVAAGEELTCDYTVFDWECDGHTFVCTCGSPRCYGAVRGFAGLSEAAKVRHSDRAHPWVLLQWQRARAGASA